MGDTEVNWDTLYDMQKNLDDYIGRQQEIVQSEKMNEKLLALLVELGELANETRCFKFWSKKPASEKGIITEEYVDGLHFLLSIGLDFNYRYQPQEFGLKENLTEAFLSVYHAVQRFSLEKDQDSYQFMFTSFLVLGSSLGIFEKELIQAYYEKNEVNFKRQDQGY